MNMSALFAIMVSMGVTLRYNNTVIHGSNVCAYAHAYLFTNTGACACECVCERMKMHVLMLKCARACECVSERVLFNWGFYD